MKTKKSEITSKDIMKAKDWLETEYFNNIESIEDFDSWENELLSVGSMAQKLRNSQKRYKGLRKDLPKVTGLNFTIFGDSKPGSYID